MDYNKVLELIPTNEDAYNNRGFNYGDLGNYQQAINDYNKAIELNPNMRRHIIIEDFLIKI